MPYLHTPDWARERDVWHSTAKANTVTGQLLVVAVQIRVD